MIEKAKKFVNFVKGLPLIVKIILIAVILYYSIRPIFFIVKAAWWLFIVLGIFVLLVLAMVWYLRYTKVIKPKENVVDFIIRVLNQKDKGE